MRVLKNKLNTLHFMAMSVIAMGVIAMANPAFAKNNTEKARMKAAGKQSHTLCSDQVANPSKLTLPVGKSTVIALPEPLASRSVAREEVVQAKLIGPKTLYLVGLDMGSTNMIIQGKSGSCTIIDVTVGIDTTPLTDALAALLPNENNIKVTAASESLVLSGVVSNASVVKQAVDIAQAFVQREFYEVNSLDLENSEDRKRVASGQYSDEPNSRIINLLSVGEQQQVMLDVKVAEVSKTLLDKLGASLSFSQTSGSWTYRLLTDFLSTTGSATGGAISGFKSAGKNFAVDAEKKDGLVKILAEPSIMAISGHEGSFLAGGTIFIPVAQNAGSNGNLITLEEKEFGVSVRFTPTVLGGGRINLHVSPEVSELNREGVGISATGFAGTSILPAFTTRKASTTVQLMDGQSFAIGGLIKNNTTTNIKAFPILGEIPILGALFRSSDFQKDITELVFIITPHLVRPLSSKEVKLPTDRYTDPSRIDLFLHGKMEGAAPTDENANDHTTNDQNDAVEGNGTGFDVK